MERLEAALLLLVLLFVARSAAILGVFALGVY